MFEQAIRKLYDHLYANAAVKSPAAIGTEIGKLLHTGLYLETVEEASPGFPVDAGAENAAENIARARAAFARMNNAWALYPHLARIDLADFDLAYACARLAGVVISDPRHDYLGDATEIFRSDWAKQAGGQFFTDQFVTRLAMTLLRFDPRNGDDLVDICAGTGGFLLAGLHHIRRLVEKESGSAGLVAPLARKALKGQDVDAGVAAVANASLNSRLGAVGDSLVSVGDSLRSPSGNSRFRAGSHLCIATNPPFGTKITIKDPAILKDFELGFAVSARAPDILFLEKNLRLLRPGRGRMAVVIPYQLLSGPQARVVRDWLLRNGKVRAVVDLPAETFQPHTGTKASLVLIERRPRPLALEDIDDTHEIFLSVPRWIGHDRRGNRVYRDENILTDFPDVEAAFEHFLADGNVGDGHKGSFLVNARTVLEEPSLRLNAAFYAQPASPRTGPPLASLVQRIFCPGRFKRAYVDPGPGAVPFLGGANISELMPTGVKWLAGDDPKLKDLRVEEGWILVTRSGSTGIVASVPAAWQDAAISEHVIRIVPDPAKIDPGYLLALLRSAYGQAYLTRGIFGSVIDEITPEYVGEMPVPALEDKALAEIAKAVRNAEAARNQAAAGFDGAAALTNRALGM